LHYGYIFYQYPELSASLFILDSERKLHKRGSRKKIFLLGRERFELQNQRLNVQAGVLLAVYIWKIHTLYSFSHIHVATRPRADSQKKSREKAVGDLLKKKVRAYTHED
jgi:hypothetical protein